MLIWAIPYTVVCLIAIKPKIGFQAGIANIVIFVITIAITGLYGIFIREVTRFVIRDHPIQTTIYVSVFSGFILTAAFLLVFVISAIPSLGSMGSQGLGWAIVGLIYGFAYCFLITAISSFISIVISQFFPLADSPTRRRL